MIYSHHPALTDNLAEIVEYFGTITADPQNSSATVVVNDPTGLEIPQVNIKQIKNTSDESVWVTSSKN